MILLLGLTLLIALIIGAHWWLRGQAGSLHQRLIAIRHDCQRLLDLVRLLQEHRGMSSALLGGDTGFLVPMLERRRLIDQALQSLAPLIKSEATLPRPCLTHNDLLLFRHRWGELLEKLPELAVDQNITLHTQLIGRALDWLSTLGETRIEQPARGRLPAGAVRNYTHHLPALAECLGQIRAVGCAVTALGECPAVSRVRLMFLVTRATTLLSQASSATSHAPAHIARERVDTLIASVRQHVLGQPIGISVEQYFNTATIAINAVYDWAEYCGAQLDLPAPVATVSVRTTT